MNENLLTESRQQIQLPSNVFLCCYHQYTNGIAWKQPNRCQHPNHKHQAGKKAQPYRTIPLKTLLLFSNHNRPPPIGAFFCYYHLKEETKKEDKTIEQTVNTSPMPSSTPVDEDFVPVEISLSNKPFPLLLNSYFLKQCFKSKSNDVSYQEKMYQ